MLEDMIFTLVIYLEPHERTSARSGRRGQSQDTFPRREKPLDGAWKSQFMAVSHEVHANIEASKHDVESAGSAAPSVAGSQL